MLVRERPQVGPLFIIQPHHLAVAALTPGQPGVEPEEGKLLLSIQLVLPLHERKSGGERGRRVHAESRVRRVPDPSETNLEVLHDIEGFPGDGGVQEAQQNGARHGRRMDPQETTASSRVAIWGGNSVVLGSTRPFRGDALRVPHFRARNLAGGAESDQVSEAGEPCNSRRTLQSFRDGKRRGLVILK